MTALPPDPDPANTPNVEASVEPGETPPESAQTAGTANPHPPTGGGMTTTAIGTIVVIAVLVLVFVATAVFLVGRMFGVFG
jgi:Family of unknown function (DUF6480)